MADLNYPMGSLNLTSVNQSIHRLSVKGALAS
jgi:hypothetical protein